ncbi:MAG: TIM barrel protein [Promethearchaeota archaeon]
MTVKSVIKLGDFRIFQTIQKARLIYSCMDYFGFTIWTELFVGDINWLISLGFKNPDDFDPEVDAWKRILSGLEDVLTKANMAGKFGGCLHVSSQIAEMTANIKLFNIYPAYINAVQEFRANMPFELGVHADFNRDVNPLGPKFIESVIKDINNALKLDAKVLVMHPPENQSYDHDEYHELFVEEITNDELCDALDDVNISLSWENMIDGQYSSLKELVLFRERLAEKLTKLGWENLIHKHSFCLDTGHLFLWQQRHHDQSLANKEIETWLPRFAENITVFHIHANDGTSDLHLTPGTTSLMDHKSRKGLKRQVFQHCSKLVNQWVQISLNHSKMENRHVHLEASRVPFNLEEYINYARGLDNII